MDVTNPSVESFSPPNDDISSPDDPVERIGGDNVLSFITIGIYPNLKDDLSDNRFSAMTSMLTAKHAGECKVITSRFAGSFNSLKKCDVVLCNRMIPELVFINKPIIVCERLDAASIGKSYECIKKKMA